MGKVLEFRKKEVFTEGEIVVCYYNFLGGIE